MKVEELLGVLKLKEYDGYKYFLHALKFIKKNELYKYDINLTSTIYPYLAKKFRKSEAAVSSSMVKALRRMYYEYHDETVAIYNDLFGTTKRLTPLQFLMECTKYITE